MSTAQDRRLGRGRRDAATQHHGLSSRIAVDSRDASKDFHIPRDKARKLFAAGLLDVDVTNSKGDLVYCLAAGVTGQEILA